MPSATSPSAFCSRPVVSYFPALTEAYHQTLPFPFRLAQSCGTSHTAAQPALSQNLSVSAYLQNHPQPPESAFSRYPALSLLPALPPLYRIFSVPILLSALQENLLFPQIYCFFRHIPHRISSYPHTTEAINDTFCFLINSIICSLVFIGNYPPHKNY